MNLPRSRETVNIRKQFTISTESARKQFLNNDINIYNMLPDKFMIQDVKEFKNHSGTFQLTTSQIEKLL